VLAPLLAACGDYSTDDRGDVGSWVRGAAMAALAALLPLWAHHRRSRGRRQPLGELQHGNGGSRGAPESGCGAVGGGADVAAEVARALVKQACERIDRLRKVFIIPFVNVWICSQQTWA
jgi:hypothetical protein